MALNTITRAVLREDLPKLFQAFWDKIKTAMQGKQNSITDLETIRSGASAGATAVQPGDLGTAAHKDVPASGNASTTQVVIGSDSRLTDARTPTSHSHGNIDNDGKSASEPTNTTKFLRADGSWQVPNSDLTDIIRFNRLGGSSSTPSANNSVIKIQFTYSATAWSSGLTLCLSVGNTYNVFGIHFHKGANTSPMVDCRVVSLKTANETKRLKFKYDNTNCVVYIGTEDTGNLASGYALFHKYSTATMSWSLVPENDSGYASAASATPANECACVTYDYSAVGSVNIPVYVDSNGRIKACNKPVQVVNSIDTSSMISDVLYVM